MATPTSRRSSASLSLGLTHSTTSRGTKSPGSSPRTPLLLHNELLSEPATLTLDNDDPSLDLDFDLLFLHDEHLTSNKIVVRPSSYHESVSKLRPTSHAARPPAVQRDWTTFNFSHYGQGAALGMRGKGRIAELYVKNREQLVREDEIEAVKWSGPAERSFNEMARTCGQG